MHQFHFHSLSLNGHLSLWSFDGENIFLNNIESLNTDDIQIVILKIEIWRENAMKPNFNLKSKIWCLFKHLILVNWNIENVYSSYEDDIFLWQIKVRRRNSLAIRKRKYLNYVWRNISLDSSDDAIAEHKDNDMWCPRMCSRCK